MAQKADSSFNILFTSVGRRVELMKAFRRAYRSLDLDGSIIAVDIDPLAPALQYVDRPYVVPSIGGQQYIPTLLDICIQEEVDLVFPLIDPDIPVLARETETFQSIGTRLAVVSLEAAELVGDKWLTVQLFDRLGLRRPRSWLPSHLKSMSMQFPVFIKPRFGSAGKGAFKVKNSRELSFFVEYVENPIIQEYLAGPEITSDVVCDLEGHLLAVVCRQRIEVRWGEVAKGITVRNSSIMCGCQAIAQALPARGPITVQCMLKDRLPYFTEINARFGGGAPLGIAAGADYPRYLLARAAGIPFRAPPLDAYEEQIYLTRFDDSLFLTEVDREQMASRRLRS